MDLSEDGSTDITRVVSSDYLVDYAGSLSRCLFFVNGFVESRTLIVGKEGSNTKSEVQLLF